MKTKRLLLILSTGLIISAAIIAFGATRKIAQPPPLAPPQPSTATPTAEPAETSKEATTTVSASPRQEPPTQSQAQASHIEVELLNVSDKGFDVHELKRPPGPFILAMANHSGKDLDALRLDPENIPNPVSHLWQVLIHKNRIHSAYPINLPIGTYLLKQSEQPGWSCKITVSPK